MTATVVEVASVTSGALNFASTPAAGEVLVVAVQSLRTPPRECSEVVGYNVTWTKLWGPVGGRTSWWIATANGTYAAIQASFVGSAALGHITGWRTTGATTTTSVNGTTGTGTSLTGPTLSAGLGQIALSVATSLATAANTTWPSAETPSGWTSTEAATATGSSTYGYARRVPGSTADHRTDISASSSVELTVATLVLGDVAAAPSADLALAGTLPSVTGAFTVTHTPLPADLALVGTLPALTGAFALDRVPQFNNLTLTGTLPALSGGFTVETPSTVRELTLAGVLPTIEGAFEADNSAILVAVDTFTRGNGRTRVGICYATVAYDPTTPPRPQRPVGIMAQQLPEPTLVDGKPT